MVAPVVSAGRGRLVWAEYRDDANGWDLAAPPRNGAVEELAHAIGGEEVTIVVGELTPEQERIVAGGAGVIMIERPLRTRRPAAVAALGWSRWIAGEADDPITLEPVYFGRN